MACPSILLLVMTVMVLVTSSESQLSYNYYESTCSNVETIVKQEVYRAIIEDITASSAFLRLIFHDCQVQGCDASILLDPDASLTNPEIFSSRNFGIRKREKIGKIKSLLEIECPGQVSCADIVALAARDAVALTGGPLIPIPLGRKDSNTSSSQQADEHLPASDISADALLYLFKGMSPEESVAILGAHTLGVGHCINIGGRLYDPKPDDQMDSLFKIELRQLCPTLIPLTNFTFMTNDLTSAIFDNQYFRSVLLGRGLFGVDASISRDPRTRPIVEKFAYDQNNFFQVFSSAFVKLSSIGVLTGPNGEIRRQCNRINI